MSKLTQSLNVVLVEPLGPLNLGSVARLCKNFEVNELRLVAPKCEPKDPEAIKMAVKGKNILKEAPIFPTLIDAIGDCTRIVATCGRKEHGDIPLCSTREAMHWLRNTSNKGSTALVFGREDRGLTNKELQLAQKVLTIEVNRNYPSLNLSHAVAIVLHELNKCEQKSSYEIINEKPQTSPANAQSLNNFLKDSQELLLEVGFLLEHTANARTQKIRALLQRADIRPEEIALIRGMLRQIRWAVRNKKK